MKSSPRTLLFVPLERAVLLGIACLWPGAVFGALAWDTQKLELTAKPEDTQITGVFHFRNAGTDAVTVTSIQPACGCTTVELAKRTYAPGETGEIKTVFTFGGATGPQEKAIRVTTSDDPDKPAILILRVTIPEIFTYSARLLLWRVAEEPVERAVTVTSLVKLAALEVDPNASTATTCRIETVKLGWKYRLHIRPKSSAAPASVPVSVVARFVDNTTRSLVVYVLVR